LFIVAWNHLHIYPILNKFIDNSSSVVIKLFGGTLKRRRQKLSRYNEIPIPIRLEFLIPFKFKHWCLHSIIRMSFLEIRYPKKTNNGVFWLPKKISIVSMYYLLNFSKNRPIVIIFYNLLYYSHNVDPLWLKIL
jgi:hypothetical protein